MRGVAFALLLLAACDKVPITNVEAAFTLADLSWFEAEETLFVFYRLDAEQGLNAESQVELTVTTDDEELDWTALAELTPVHQHKPVDCGPKTRCGSISVHVEKQPRRADLRLRYHPDGLMVLTVEPRLHIVRRGAAHSNRSMIVYGVFDATNSWVQWRGRHTFPALRNEQVQGYGLRRRFLVDGQRYGGAPAVNFGANPYGYGFASVCPGAMTALSFDPVETTERAAFNGEELPLIAAPAPAVCGEATVFDARGTFTTGALARKNPHVRQAFPLLRSPIREDTQLGYLLAPCRRTISKTHRDMQVQRLRLESRPLICIDDWDDAGFADDLALRWQADIDAARTSGNDMVLTIALHHDETSRRLGRTVEDALLQFVPNERAKSSPRLAGVFLFDSVPYEMQSQDLARVVLWCPAKLLGPEEEVIDPSEQSCPILPDIPDLTVGPFRFSVLPILPTRKQYLSFIDRYSEAQAGKVQTLRFLAPEKTPVSDEVEVDQFAVVTFFNDEVLTAQATDAFSFCADKLETPLVFRSIAQPALPLLPIPVLPDFHEELHETTYGLGLLWDFPFLMRMDYETVISGAVTAFSVSVAFGIDVAAAESFGAGLWSRDEFEVGDALLQCERFCDHPVFDSFGVYNVQIAFKPLHLNTCYRPRYPFFADGGFPSDP